MHKVSQWLASYRYKSYFWVSNIARVSHVTHLRGHFTQAETKVPFVCHTENQQCPSHVTNQLTSTDASPTQNCKWHLTKWHFLTLLSETKWTHLSEMPLDVLHQINLLPSVELIELKCHFSKWYDRRVEYKITCPESSVKCASVSAKINATQAR